MLLKKQVYQTSKKANPLIGVLLFLIAVVFLMLTGPIGLVYGIFHALITKGFRGLGDYFLKIAISIDQLGNVMMQHLLNVLWTKNTGYRFGNRDETISSAIGRNKQLKTLTKFGRLIDTVLDKIDPNHSLNSIDYYIEPSSQIIDKLAWVHPVNGQILCLRNKGKKHFTIPGGKQEKYENDVKALCRQIKEKLTVELDMASLSFIGIFEAQADGYKPEIMVRITCYSATYKGELEPGSKIEELTWFNYADREMVSPVDMLIFDFLKDAGLLV